MQWHVVMMHFCYHPIGGAGQQLTYSAAMSAQLRIQSRQFSAIFRTSWGGVHTLSVATILLLVIESLGLLQCMQVFLGETVRPRLAQAARVRRIRIHSW